MKEGTTSVDKNPLSIQKEMMANDLTKALSIIKHEHLMKTTRIDNKIELLALIKQEDSLRDVFQQRGIDISNLFRFRIIAF